MVERVFTSMPFPAPVLRRCGEGHGNRTRLQPARSSMAVSRLRTAAGSLGESLFSGEGTSMQSLFRFCSCSVPSEQGREDDAPVGRLCFRLGHCQFSLDPVYLPLYLKFSGVEV